MRSIRMCSTFQSQRAGEDRTFRPGELVLIPEELDPTTAAELVRTAHATVVVDDNGRRVEVAPR